MSDSTSSAGGGKPVDGGESNPLSDALGSSRLGHIDPSAPPSGSALLGAMGGVRGLVESLLPGVAFLVLYTITRDVVISVLVPLGIAVAFVAVRVLTKGQPTLAFAGLIGVGVSAAIALFTGEAENNFLWGFIVNSVVLIALVISLIAKRPLVGFIVAGLTGTPHAWRTEPAKRAVAVRATWMWVAVVALRLAVQIPLYVAEATTALAATKLIMGVPLYGAALWVTWLMVRSVSGTPSRDDRAQQE